MISHSLILVVGPKPSTTKDLLSAELDSVYPDPIQIADKIAEKNYESIIAQPQVMASLLERFRRNEDIVSHIEQGLAAIDLSGMVVWANSAFRRFDPAGGDPIGLPFLAALGGARVASVEQIDDHDPGNYSPSDPLDAARQGHPTSIRLFSPNSQHSPYLSADIRPVVSVDGRVSQLIAVIQNVTPEVTQQQKLDALHAAGRELAGLDADQLADMNIPSRIELLKLNLRKYIHDLLQYDTIEVRVLDRRTGELKPLLQDGMTDEAANRTLYAQPTNNGVTGFVAATGQSYLCQDTAADLLYIQGAEGARSSMTVPLMFQDQVIGTLNVESPRPNGFRPDDLQFTELFSREIATALHTLDLLSAQQECTASQSIEAVNKEIALPIDEVLASASLLIGKAFADPETTVLLRRILDNARLVKQSVSKVGRDLTPRPGMGEMSASGAPKSGIRPIVVRSDLPVPPASMAADPDMPLFGFRVLVVDSDERVRRQAHLILTRLGATTETASTAAAGLAMAIDNAYSAVLLEVKPPDMGGYECYRRFRIARPSSILALTTGFGYDVAHAIVKARQDGLRHVLFKPFREDQLLKAVLEAVASNHDSS